MCRGSNAFRFVVDPDEETRQIAALTKDAARRLKLDLVTLRVASDAFQWRSCNATQAWSIGQVIEDPEPASCAIVNAGYGRRIFPGNFAAPGQFELNLTDFFQDQFPDDPEFMLNRFSFQLSMFNQNSGCHGELTRADLTVIQTATF
eukprot:Protomagalhaensia_wolfi_Nauph_80__5775@NODE_70_length_3999_cov_84_067929_g55_i0_p4_GENE_NODE_70_length_3999_cov_84_067929_g55_i0NODE_70_length_3999_cov_84_067929_g55_i0_p4_ORF_typecomplete_len147_score25_03_NODE_70_length_3999_cov_84_067929_g55_i016022042